MKVINFFKKDYFRIVLYLALFSIFALMPVNTAAHLGYRCPIKAVFGVPCPGCGITRAFANIMHFNFQKAISYNAFFVFGLFPVSVFLIIDDIITIILRYLKKTKRKSMIEFSMSFKRD